MGLRGKRWSFVGGWLEFDPRAVFYRLSDVEQVSEIYFPISKMG